MNQQINLPQKFNDDTWKCVIRTTQQFQHNTITPRGNNYCSSSSSNSRSCEQQLLRHSSISSSSTVQQLLLRELQNWTQQLSQQQQQQQQQSLSQQQQQNSLHVLNQFHSETLKHFKSRLISCHEPQYLNHTFRRHCLRQWRPWRAVARLLHHLNIRLYCNSPSPPPTPPEHLSAKLSLSSCRVSWPNMRTAGAPSGRLRCCAGRLGPLKTSGARRSRD